MLAKHFKPKGSFQLIRLGKKGDCGYLVDEASVKKAQVLISFGIGLDCSFEKAFVKLSPVPVFAYDHTTSFLCFARDILLQAAQLRLRRTLSIIFSAIGYYLFFRKTRVHHCLQIGPDHDCSQIGPSIVKRISLDTIINQIKPRSLFLKVDIESSEYRILDDILKHSENLCGLVIEFHNIDLHQDRLKNFLTKFPLELIHIHGNNMDFIDENSDPMVVEMTFSNTAKKISDQIILPHPLDTPSNLKYPELPLHFD